MKKITSFLMVLFVALGAMAQDPNLAEDYTLVKSATFGGSIDVATSGDALSITAYETGNAKQQKIYPATAPEEIVGWMAFQAAKGSGSKGWWNRSSKGLYSYGGTRSAAVYGESLTLGSVVAITCTGTASNVITLTNANGESDGPYTYQLSADGKTYYCTITAEENGYVGFCGKNSVGYITSISIYQPKQALLPSTYTIKYQDEDGNQIKEDAIVDGISGTSISIAASEKNNYVKDNVCYIYVSDDSEGKTIANDGSTVVTITYRKAAEYSYTVNAVDGEGNVLKVLSTGSYFETESVPVFYSRYILKDGVLYERAANKNEYKHTFTLSSDEMVVNVDYGKSATANAVYFSEAEDIESVTPYEDGYTNIRMSNGVAAYAKELSTITSLPAGVYTLKSASRVCNTTFYAGSREVLTMSTDGSVVDPTSEEFTLYEPTEIKVSAGSNKNYFDYVLICRVGDAPIRELVITEGEDFAPEYDAYSSATYTPTIAEGAYGTICLPFAPDAASLENYTFFKMESAGADAINFVEETAPQANTPYICCLKGENVAITGGATVVSADINSVEVGNWTMKGSFTKQTIATAGADTKYYGYVADQNKIVKANKTLTVLPYRAYFTAPVDAAAVALRITRGDETTEITTADLDVQPATVIYDLAGRRVEKMEKGIYIVNGKKVIR